MFKKHRGVPDPVLSETILAEVIRFAGDGCPVCLTILDGDSFPVIE